MDYLLAFPGAENEIIDQLIKTEEREWTGGLQIAGGESARCLQLRPTECACSVFLCPPGSASNHLHMAGRDVDLGDHTAIKFSMQR